MTNIAAVSQGSFRAITYFIISFITITISFILTAEAAKVIKVDVDSPRIIKLPKTPESIIIGKPNVADVSLEPGNRMIIYGKTHGSTNIMILDREGKSLGNLKVIVITNDVGKVSLYMGTKRKTMECYPKCENGVYVGDDPNIINENASAQTVYEAFIKGNIMSIVKKQASSGTPAN